MPRILVTPLSALDDAIASHRPSHIVTLLSPEHMIRTPDGFPEAMHLKRPNEKKIALPPRTPVGGIITPQ